MQPDLTNIQAQLKQALVSRAAADTHAGIADEIVDGTLSAQRRIAIYRHNIFTNLSNTLSELYPVVKRIVGEVFFTEAAHTFIAATPSRSGDLHQFGCEFGDFLAGYAHACELPYLPDVARLEWRWHLAFHAADAAPFALSQLATISPESMRDLCFILHPSVSLVSSPYPLLQIWQFNQPDVSKDMEIDWQISQAYFVIYRPVFDVTIRQLTVAQFTFLAELNAKASLEKAWEAAAQCDAAFDLQGFIADCVQSQVIINFEIPI